MTRLGQPVINWSAGRVAISAGNRFVIFTLDGAVRLRAKGGAEIAELHALLTRIIKTRAGEEGQHYFKGVLFDQATLSSSVCFPPTEGRFAITSELLLDLHCWTGLLTGAGDPLGLSELELAASGCSVIICNTRSTEVTRSYRLDSHDRRALQEALMNAAADPGHSVRRFLRLQNDSGAIELGQDQRGHFNLAMFHHVKGALLTRLTRTALCRLAQRLEDCHG